MTSDEARELFSEAYDGTLGERQAELAAALEADPGLGAEWEQFRTLLDETRAMGLEDQEAEVPDLLAGVQRKLRQRSRGRYYRDRFARGHGAQSLFPLLIGIILLAVIAVAWLGMHYAQVEQAPAPRPHRTAPRASDPLASPAPPSGVTAKPAPVCRPYSPHVAICHGPRAWRRPTSCMISWRVSPS